MHRLSELNVSNFRSCVSTYIKLEPFTPLVGYNNAGKSNILKCIDMLVRGKAQDASSFNDPTSPIEIIALLEGLDENSLAHISAQQRTSLEQYIEDGALKIRFYQEPPGAGSKSITLNVRRPSETHGQWNNPNGLSQAITTLFSEPTFINSMEDSAEDVPKFKAGNTIGKLILNLQKQIISAKGAEINAVLEGVGKKLNLNGAERLEEFSTFDTAINSKVCDFFPGLSLNIDIPTPNISDLFKQGTVKVKEEGVAQTSEFKDMGHGAQRAIQMTLIRHLAEITKNVAKEGKTNLLLIDEPELFLHPQAIELVRGSLKQLSRRGYQVIFSTHSPFMIDHEDIPITNVVRKKEQGTKVEVRLKEAIDKVIEDHDTQARILFDTYNLSQILFSDSVIIAEGSTEKHILPTLFKTLTGKTLGESKLALVIAEGSPNIPGMLSILKEMNIPAKALVDLDFAFTVAKSSRLIDAENPEVRGCLDVLQKIQSTHGFRLNDRLPCKGNGFKAADIYEILAQDEEAKVYIGGLRNCFIDKSIWLWPLGAIEPHLSLETKSTGEWFRFKQKLLDGHIDEVVEDRAHISEFVEWCIAV